MSTAAPRPPLRDVPWLDRPDAPQAIDAARQRGELTAEQAKTLHFFRENGYVDLGNVLDGTLADALDASLMSFLERNRDKPVETYIDQCQNRYTSCEATRSAVCHPAILQWCDLVLGTRALPFQTLSIYQGTQIFAHADQILMSTQPRGYLVVAWCALEDVRPDAGPLRVWPGSHRLPYVTPDDIGVSPTAERGEAARLHNERYYPRIRRLVEEAGIQPVEYLPRKGDVLLWHSNLVHGGAPIVRPDSTRKSLVIHYFGEGAQHVSDLFHEPCALPGLR